MKRLSEATVILTGIMTRGMAAELPAETASRLGGFFFFGCRLSAVLKRGDGNEGRLENGDGSGDGGGNGFASRL
ncbi:MAG: hypothetical protein K2N35_07775 [Muribaculaceae bacterium]|nr:hypothetical protein [Muribaculaceae bacterium]